MNGSSFATPGLMRGVTADAVRRTSLPPAAMRAATSSMGARLSLSEWTTFGFGRHQFAQVRRAFLLLTALSAAMSAMAASLSLSRWTDLDSWLSCQLFHTVSYSASHLCRAAGRTRCGMMLPSQLVSGLAALAEATEVTTAVSPEGDLLAPLPEQLVAPLPAAAPAPAATPAAAPGPAAKTPAGAPYGVTYMVNTAS